MKRNGRLNVLFFAWLLSSFGSLAQAADETIKEKWAVLVGVNDYAELDDLQFCKNDAIALAEQLVKAGFPRDNVFLLTDRAADAKDLPNKANIETRIRSVLRVIDKGDLVLVSFSGHGVHLDGKTYLCPTGARVDDPDSTMIQLRVVYDSLNQCKATRKLLWVDACRDDPRPSGMKSAATHARSTAGLVASLEATPEGILTLASCAAGQISWEDQKLGHGVFMHYLLEGLSGKADREETGNRDNRVSLLELYNYSNIRTKRFVLNEHDRAQTPELFGRITGDFDIVAENIEELIARIRSLQARMAEMEAENARLESGLWAAKQELDRVGGGDRSPSPKHQLTTLVRKIDLLTSDVALNLSDEQGAALAKLLGKIKPQKAMTEDDASAVNEEIVNLFDDDQITKLEAICLPTGGDGRGGRPRVGGLGGLAEGGEEDEKANPFAEQRNAQAVDALLGRFGEPPADAPASERERNDKRAEEPTRKEDLPETPKE